MLHEPHVAARRAPGALIAIALLATGIVCTSQAQQGADGAQLQAERDAVSAWRVQRVNSLTSDSGWLTLTGLLWLKDGANSFGRASGNALVLDNAALAATAGSFEVSAHKVRFVANPAAGVTHDGQPVGTIDLVSDAAGPPTVLASGSLRFFVIERSGNLGVRVRDLNNPHRLQFRGLSYFPVSTDWLVHARFESYQPQRHIKIINILGMEDDAVSPGAVVFNKDGREWRLDTVLEAPADKELFIMFADTTDRKSTRLNSSHQCLSRMPSSA